MKNENRIKAEKTIARKVVKDALAAGYALSVWNGGDEAEISNSTEFSKIMKEMFATDMEKLVFSKEGKQIGWVLFVYGNEGYDVMSDWTVNLDEVLKGAMAKADEIEARS